MQAGIKHFVWSGLEDVRKVPGVTDKLKEISDGHYVPHFESKAAITVNNVAPFLDFLAFSLGLDVLDYLKLGKCQCMPEVRII
jgi:hypothetical protein